MVLSLQAFANREDNYYKHMFKTAMTREFEEIRAKDRCVVIDLIIEDMNTFIPMDHKMITLIKSLKSIIMDIDGDTKIKNESCDVIQTQLLKCMYELELENNLRGFILHNSCNLVSHLLSTVINPLTYSIEFTLDKLVCNICAAYLDDIKETNIEINHIHGYHKYMMETHPERYDEFVNHVMDKLALGAAEDEVDLTEEM